MWFEQGKTRVYYEEEGTGVPLLLMPGFAGSIEDLADVRAALSPAYRVIAADLPGSGRSLPQPRAYARTYHTEDAGTFVALLEGLGTGPAHLVGYSDGGEVALAMAALSPGIARSVVTWGAMGFINESELPVFDAFATVVDAPVESLRRFSDYLKATYGEENARSMTQSFAAACRSIVEDGGDIVRSKAKDIRCPALLIAGENDFIAPPAGASQLAGELPRGEFLLRSGAGHDVHRSHGEWLCQTMLEWLSRH
jgi:valacyclovir hydrolase